LTGLVVLVAGAAMAADSGELLALVNVTVIDGNGGRPRPGMTLVVADGRIAEMFATGEKPIAPGARLLDVDGHYVIPGLIDSHVHVTLDPARTSAGLPHLLRGGVTTVRDMGGDSSWLSDLREATWSPAAAAPRVNFAVALVGPVQLGRPRSLPTRSGTRFSIIPWLTTFADQTPTARLLALIKNTGATGIKLYSDIPTTRVRELVAEARWQGLKVWSHARIYPGKPSDAVEAGVEVLSHSSLLACEVAQTEQWCNHTASVDSAPLEQLLLRMRDRGTVLEPTLAILRNTAIHGGGNPKRVRSVPTTDWATAVTRKAHAIGVRIVAGSDVHLAPNAPAAAIHDEVELLVAAGLSPLEAITAATRTGAEVLGLDSVTGTLEVGKWADVVVLAADPTRDIRHTRSVTHVIKGGHVVAVQPSPTRPRSFDRDGR
jgi:imidazolonepropionase-like amidohydrolase